MELCLLRNELVHQNAINDCYVVHGWEIKNYLASDVLFDTKERFQQLYFSDA